MPTAYPMSYEHNRPIQFTNLSLYMYTTCMFFETCNFLLFNFCIYLCVLPTPPYTQASNLSTYLFLLELFVNNLLLLLSEMVVKGHLNSKKKQNKTHTQISPLHCSDYNLVL